jgi:4-diphosphocytidyl-2-C-methyl-D-erythritol kinase
MLLRREDDCVVAAAPAKLNLFLQVLGKRADGYHELETLMVSLDLCDTLRFAPDSSGDLTLDCFDVGANRDTGSRHLPPDANNLVLRAAELLRRETATRAGAHIDLFKRIPLAAGLGGGSSDAAATLAALNLLWNLKLSTAELQSLSARLGSDIPFFFTTGAAAVCRGRGEKIEPVSLPLGLHFVVARPKSGLSTAEVFRHCRPAAATRTPAELIDALKSWRLRDAGAGLHNALQEPAERLNADVVRLRELFSTQPFFGHQMSGSGTSYFGLCATRRQAHRLAARIRARRLGDVFAASSRP